MHRYSLYSIRMIIFYDFHRFCYVTVDDYHVTDTVCADVKPAISAD
jgi:hypothetical protein